MVLCGCYIIAYACLLVVLVLGLLQYTDIDNNCDYLYCIMCLSFCISLTFCQTTFKTLPLYMKFSLIHCSKENYFYLTDIMIIFVVYSM